MSKKYYVTESTVMALSAVKAVKSGYMSLLLPGEKRLYPKQDGEDTRIAFGGAGRISDAGEVFQVPVPFAVNEAELEADDEEIAVSSAQFDKMIEMCSRSGGDLTVITADEGIMTFTNGQVKGSIRYFAPADVPYKPELETKGEPRVKIVVKSEAFMKRIRFASCFGADGIDLRITQAGKLKVLPTLFSGQMMAESECAPEEIIDLDYKKGEKDVDISIPSKYKDFFLSGIYGEKMTISVYAGAFAVSSGGASFKGSLMAEARLIPESLLAGKMGDIRQYDVIAAFMDRQELIKNLGITQIWEEMVKLSGYPKGIMKMMPNDKDDIKLHSTDSFSAVIKSGALRKSEAAKSAYHFVGSDITKILSAFTGETVTLGMTTGQSKGGDGTMALLLDGVASDKKMIMLGNRVILLGQTSAQYEEMEKTCAIAAKKAPKELEEEARKEKEEKKGKK